MGIRTRGLRPRCKPVLELKPKLSRVVLSEVSFTGNTICQGVCGVVICEYRDVCYSC